MHLRPISENGLGSIGREAVQVGRPSFRPSSVGAGEVAELRRFFASSSSALT